MNENRRVKAWSLVALGAVATGPLVVAVVAAATSACGGSSNAQPNTAPTGTMAMGQAPPGYPPQQQAYPPGYPQPQPGYPQQQPAGYPAQQPAGYPPAQPQPAPAPTAAPTALAPTDPNSLQGILQGLQGALSGTLVSPGGLAGDLTDAGLKAQAMRVAPGMQPEGDELKQNLAEGQHAVIMVTLQAGKCYTVVGFSPIGGVKNLDLNLLAPPLYMTLAGQDLTHNNTPTIGAAPTPMCPVLMFPLQYKLDVFAQAGAGQVAVQLYSKNK